MKFLKDFLSKFKAKNNGKKTIEDPEFTPEDLEYTRQKLFKALKTEEKEDLMRYDPLKIDDSCCGPYRDALKKEETEDLTDGLISEFNNKYIEFNGDLFAIKEKLDKFGPEPHYRCQKVQGFENDCNAILAVQPSGRVVKLKILPLGQRDPDYSCMGRFYYLDSKDNVEHREVGPAIAWENGDQTWLFLGKTHRLDGPARTWKCSDERVDWSYHVGGYCFYQDEESYSKAVEAFKKDPEQINKEPNKIIDSVISACAISNLIDPKIVDVICKKQK